MYPMVYSVYMGSIKKLISDHKKLFQGRVGRLPFFVWTLYFLWFPLIELTYLLYFTTTLYKTFKDPTFWIDAIASFLIILPLLLIPVASKRLNDIGWSRWFSILIAIPLINIPTVLVLSAFRGKNIDEHTKQPRFRGYHFLFIILFIVFLFLGFSAIYSKFHTQNCEDGEVCLFHTF